MNNTDINNRNLSIFNFGSNTIRVLADNPQQPYFVAKDVCEVLELKDPSKAIKQAEDRLKEADIEGAISNRTLLKTAGGKQTLITINEQGLYELIFASRKKQAVKFRAWVTGQILPQLRKTGTYTLPKPPTIRRINAQSRSRVRDMVRELVDNYPDHYFAQNPQDQLENFIYQKRSAYLLTYSFIKTYFNLDKGGYRNLTADELNCLETLLFEKQDEFLGIDVFVFMLNKTSPNNIIAKEQNDNSAEPSSQITDFVDDNKPSEIDFFHYSERDNIINASIYSVRALLDKSETVSFFENQPNFALKLETLEHAYQVANTMGNQIYEKSTQLKKLIKELTGKQQGVHNV